MVRNREPAAEGISPHAGDKHLEQCTHREAKKKGQNVERPVQWEEDSRLAIRQQRGPRHDVGVPQREFHPMKGFPGNFEKGKELPRLIIQNRVGWRS